MSGGLREERMGDGGWNCRCALRRPLYDIRHPYASRLDAHSPPQVAVHRIDYPYPLSAIRYPLSAIPSLLYNSLFQANPSRPIRELAAAGPQLPAV